MSESLAVEEQSDEVCLALYRAAKPERGGRTNIWDSDSLFYVDHVGDGAFRAVITEPARGVSCLAADPVTAMSRSLAMYVGMLNRVRA